MGFGEAISTGFRKYIKTGGRATRPEFWYWTLFSVLVGVAANVVDGVIASSTGSNQFGLVAGLVNIALFLPGLAVTIRRLHDTDHSGWWILLPLTIIGIIPYVIWLCRAGTPGANRYGLGSSADIAGVFGGGPAYGAAPMMQNIPPVGYGAQPSTAAERDAEARGTIW